ncbi:hypothetical protein [Planomonospora parontospora]|uniref:hypothetical protein n=1 Tax=Planomonospora parontospora TaxID=58119 RepID=UPI0016706FE6|nr:hypothetical protein [Planomonospora parontospora]GII18533.1 hypothetical protein Ppa05_52590 [Planomonospora parontospora subsp. antibiotica]
MTSDFPGRWAGGATMVAAPLLLLAGALLRVPYDFFYPAQLAAHESEPALLTASYALIAAGTFLLWPAVALLAARIGPGWGLAGGLLAMSGLFARVFHAGADHMAFRLTDVVGADLATEVVSETYGAFQPLSFLNVAILAGWPVLAFGAWRAEVLGPVRALALASAAALPLGVLKGTTPLSLVALAGLAIAFGPYGFAVLTAHPRPSRAAVLRWAPITLAAVGLMVVLGQAG